MEMGHLDTREQGSVSRPASTRWYILLPEGFPSGQDEYGGDPHTSPGAESSHPHSSLSPHGRAINHPSCIQFPSEPGIHPACVQAFLSQAHDLVSKLSHSMDPHCSSRGGSPHAFAICHPSQESSLTTKLFCSLQQNSRKPEPSPAALS